MFAAIKNTKDKYELINTDQTGGFKDISSKVYKYILVLYDYDINNIISEPLKSRIQGDIP